MLLEVVGDTVINRIVDFLIEGRGLDYTKKDIADGCEISRPTLYKVLPLLIKAGIAKPTRTLGNVQLYALNEANERVKILLKLEEMLLKKSFEEVGMGKIKVPA